MKIISKIVRVRLGSAKMLTKSGGGLFAEIGVQTQKNPPM